MTWTYAQPTGSPMAWPTLKDHIRYLLGDKVQSDWSPSDEEVMIAIAEWNVTYPDHEDDLYGIAAMLAVSILDWIGVSGMSSMSKSVGNSSLSREYGNRLAGWRRIVSRLKLKSPVLAGGMAMSSMGLASQPPAERQFTIGQFDNGYTPIPGEALDLRLER